MKGIIAQIKDNKAVLLTENGEFVVIANKKYAVGQRVVYTKRNPVKMFAACACFFLMFSSLLGYGARYVPVSFVDIDINPSMRMKLNIYENVIGIDPLNKDAAELLENERLDGSFESCVNEIIILSQQKGYLNSDNKTVSLYIVSGNSKIEEHAKHLGKNDNLDMQIHSSSRGELKAARKKGVSIGKMTESSAEKHSYTPDEALPAEEPIVTEEHSTDDKQKNGTKESNAQQKSKAANSGAQAKDKQNKTASSDKINQNEIKADSKAEAETKIPENNRVKSKDKKMKEMKKTALPPA